MNTADLIFEEVAELYRVIPLKVLRRTEGVYFDNVPTEAFQHIDAFDRVIHEHGATSPGPVGDVDRPWYMHPCQEDNLIVLAGTRFIEIYTKKHGRIESFVVAPQRIEKNGEVLFDGPAMLVWPTKVFHRILSDEVMGSASLNFAVHLPDFDIRSNFNVYDLNTETGEYICIREGHLDQPAAVA